MNTFGKSNQKLDTEEAHHNLIEFDPEKHEHTGAIE